MSVFLKRFLRPDENVKVIVLGHQKSGTTAIARLLSKISCMKLSNDPLYRINHGRGTTAQSVLREPGKLETQCMRRHNLFYQPIIKEPDFTFIYPLVRQCYDDVRYLFIMRDPRDMIRSICDRLGLPGNSTGPSPKSSAMKRGTRHWELILSGLLPEENGLGDGSSSYIRKLAHRWNMAAKVYLNFTDEMKLAKYEDFLADKEGFIENLAEEVGLPCVRPITKYVDVQFQPKGNPNVNWLDFFGNENLTGIEEICGEAMQEYGYKPLTTVSQEQKSG